MSDDLVWMVAHLQPGTVVPLRYPQFLVMTTGSRLFGRSFLRQMNAAIEAINHAGSRNLGAGPPWGSG